jgi:glucose/arabinose dehydrogenase
LKARQAGAGSQPFFAGAKAARRSTLARRAALVLATAALAAPAQAALAAPARAAAPRYYGSLLGTFNSPLDVTQAPGDPTAVFVVEARGRVMLIRDGQVLPKPFLDIENIVLAPPDGAGDQGLLSIAFPPDYQNSRRFYVYFTANSGAIEIDEFRTSAQNPDHALRSSRRRVMKIPHRWSDQHYGGQLQFGPDGLLYFATGDGGKPASARNLDHLLGKVIRIDPRPHHGQPYRVPPSNPYVGMSGRRPEIFSYGLRNPWRFSFDGDLIAIGDVGAGTWEEVDLLPIRDARGANFGWPKYEGDALWPGNPPGPEAPDPPTFPMFTVSHDSGACALIGGYVVRDPSLPDLLGRYLYGDHCTGEIRSFIPDVADQTALDDASVGVSAPAMDSFGEGVEGQIYWTQADGEVFRLTESGVSSP